MSDEPILPSLPPLPEGITPPDEILGYLPQGYGPVATGLAMCHCWCHQPIGPTANPNAARSCIHCQVYG